MLHLQNLTSLFTMTPRGVFENLSNIMVEHRNYISMEGALRENINS